MPWPIIHKSFGPQSSNPHGYAAMCREFSWEKARSELNGLPGGGLNIAYEAVDRHVARGDGARLALRWLSKTGERRDFRYADLASLSSRFANVLKRAGVGKGEVVFSLAGRVPELYIACLGTLKNGSVFSPLFSVFGPEPVRTRIERGDGRVLVTTRLLYEKKVAPWRKDVPGLKHVFLIDVDEKSAPAGTISLAAAMSGCSDVFDIVRTQPEDTALLHFTSGTTGRPKGAIHVHEAVVAHHATGKYALDFQPGDVFWCTADPGWITGTSYGIISPLTNGITLIVDEAEFDAERWYRILREQNVSVWYTAPTAIRMLVRIGEGFIPKGTFDNVRFLASVGEPLNPEAVVWSQQHYGKPFHDNWWQTETGGIMIANIAAEDIKPGSMGRPVPGVVAAIVERCADGVRVLETPMTSGELALKRGWPSMFRGYLHEEERYRKNFVGDWYLTGDLAMRDEDGYFWFVGRGDDVIKSAGHLIGPFEVESALLEHPAVAEAAVVGIPDPVAGETVKAFVALKPGFEPGEDLRKEIHALVRKRLGPAIAPKDIAFRAGLPRTRSGKIMRRLLKARELGLPEGDISTLESDEK